MKASKNPYEIRAELLRLAYDIVRGQKNAECSEKSELSDDNYLIVMDRAPTSDEVIAEATKLNNFVSQTAE